MNDMNKFRPCDDWARMLEQARKLDWAELRRHSLVSLRNNHSCVECFTCSCVAVREEQAKARKAGAR